VAHVALRAEYRGFVYDRPDFGLPALNTRLPPILPNLRQEWCSGSSLIARARDQSREEAAALVARALNEERRVLEYEFTE